MSTKIEMMLEELQQAAEQMGIKVSFEKMTGLCAGKGGMCKVGSEYRIIADRKSTVQERLDILLDALSGFDLESVYLSPRTRQALERVAQAQKEGTHTRTATVEEKTTGEKSAEEKTVEEKTVEEKTAD